RDSRSSRQPQTDRVAVRSPRILAGILPYRPVARCLSTINTTQYLIIKRNHYLSKIIEQTTMSIDKNEFRKYAIKHHRIGSQHVDGFIGRVERKMPTSLTPYIIEERQMNVAQMDVFSRLMMDRIIFMGDPVGDQVANIIQAQLLFLQSADAQRDIQIYINSPGGSVYAGLG